MTNNLKRRLERLEHITRPTAQTGLRAFARKLGLDEEFVLALAQGHERQLAPHLGEDGLITPEGFQLFCGWLPRACPGSTDPIPVGPQPGRRSERSVPIPRSSPPSQNLLGHLTNLTGEEGAPDDFAKSGSGTRSRRIGRNTDSEPQKGREPGRGNHMVQSLKRSRTAEKET